jgi:microcompartment protein CcmK/EutM
MKLCRVIGTSTSTVKQPVYERRKVLIVTPVGIDLEPRGASFLAVDFQQAGIGDTVLVAQEGNTARQLAGDPSAPIHSAVMGIVDCVETPDGEVWPPEVRRA